jgi:8-oxo-dGTP pyrophosphatase MutT (NUDIX family)
MFFYLSLIFVGHVDPGENDMETALRETEEEAGYTKDQLRVTSFTKTLSVCLIIFIHVLKKNYNIFSFSMRYEGAPKVLSTG